MEKVAVAADAKQAVKERLSQVIDALPVEKAEAVLDYAEYLEAKQAQADLQTGTFDALLKAVEKYGGLRFEPGELEQLLAEIDEARHLGYVDPE